MTELMSNQRDEQPHFDIFEPDYIEASQMESAEAAAEIAMTLGGMAMQFAHVERVPRYDEWSRENDAEHSFMLSLVATEIAAQYYPQLNTGLVAQFATVHDLVEIATDDVATFTLDDDAMAAKKAAEHDALEGVLRTLPPYTANLLRRYEEQVEPEARFVCMTDKILPVIVDILGPGKKVMAEDYDIITSAQLDANERRLSNKIRERLPENELAFMHVVRGILAAQFAVVFDQTEA